jgi:molybdenum cofactor synthesis domain-containing protein
MIQKIPVEKAVGLPLAHDITRILPGKFKGVGFRRGHVVRPSDIPGLLDLGKKQVYVLKLKPGELHEDDAARRIARAVAGKNLILRGPQEGKINFMAKTRGLLKVYPAVLRKINAVGGLILSTRHSHSCVFPGDVVGGTRAIPLVLPERKVKRIEAICRRHGPVIEILPFKAKKVGIIVTGSEIYEKRIKDHSASILKKKLKAFGSRGTRNIIVPDDPLRIAEEIRRMKKAGNDIVIVTGGLSVDPDDRSLEGIRRSGAKVAFYGVPILPGSMSAYAQLGRTVILGAPACMVHEPITALDLFLPRVLAGDPIQRKEVDAMGHGGLCLKCRPCHFPRCPFGKGT